MKHAKQIKYNELSIGDNFYTTDVNYEYENGLFVKKTISTVVDTVTDIKVSKTGRILLITEKHGRWSNGPINPDQFLENA